MCPVGCFEMDRTDMLLGLELYKWAAQRSERAGKQGSGCRERASSGK